MAEESVVNKSSDVLKAHVSPNPASGTARLLLESYSEFPVEMELIDMAGKTYKKMKFSNSTSGSFNFSVADLAPGIYIIKVKQGKTLTSTKLIIHNRSLR